MDPKDEDNIFRQFFTGNPLVVVDVVGEKRKKFQLILESAFGFISTGEYVNASKCFEEAIDTYKNDPYPDEYDFTNQEEVIMEYLLCYSYLFGGIKVDTANGWIVELNKTYGNFQQVCISVLHQTNR